MPLPNAPQAQPMPGGPPPGGMPKSPVSGPGGPGGSPMLSPGSGAGNKAAALAGINNLVKPLVNYMLAFPVGSKEFQQVQRAVESLSSLVGKAALDPNMNPAAAKALAAQAGKGQLSSAPPPGVAPTNTPPPGIDMPPGMSAEESAG